MAERPMCANCGMFRASDGKRCANCDHYWRTFGQERAQIAAAKAWARQLIGGCR
jgi:tRNA(Ile2) C34 agmatinyltransferase TiaS